MPKKILLVCTGNTCRSPMAEGLMKKTTAGRDIEILSAGTGAFPGMPPSAEAIKVMVEEGIDITQHKSRPIDGFLLEEADKVYVMTEEHLRIITGWFKSMDKKVKLLRQFDPVKDDGFYPNIPDPIGSSVEEYRRVREMLKRAIAGLEEEL